MSNISSIPTILRLSNHYGCDVKGKNFVHQALEKLTANEPVSADDDIIFSPTYIGTRVSSLQELCMARLEFIILQTEPLSKYRLLLNLANELSKSSLVTTFLAKRPKSG